MSLSEAARAGAPELAAEATAWSLQHAVFVPQHTSRSAHTVSSMLDAAGFQTLSSEPLIDEMTTLVIATRN